MISTKTGWVIKLLSAIVIGLFPIMLSYLQDSLSVPPDKQDSVIVTPDKQDSVSVLPDKVEVPVDLSKVTIDEVRVFKSQRQLSLLADGKVVRSYPVRLGGAPMGHKRTEGDGRTPEGRYLLDWRNPQSRFYKSLHVSYPNEADRAQARERHVRPGGEIMVHGSVPKSLGDVGSPLYDYLSKSDWTLGCIALSNQHMDEVWENVAVGTPILIYP